jgi:hypothetical protein
MSMVTAMTLCPSSSMCPGIDTPGQEQRRARVAQIVKASVDDLQGGFPAVPLTTKMHKAPFPIEGASEPGVEVSITPDAFPVTFAPDLPSEIAQVLAVSQRPLAHTAFAEPAGAAAWKTKPCFKSGHLDRWSCFILAATSCPNSARICSFGGRLIRPAARTRPRPYGRPSIWS